VALSNNVSVRHLLGDNTGCGAPRYRRSRVCSRRFGPVFEDSIRCIRATRADAVVRTGRCSATWSTCSASWPPRKNGFPRRGGARQVHGRAPPETTLEGEDISDPTGHRENADATRHKPAASSRAPTSSWATRRRASAVQPAQTERRDRRDANSTRLPVDGRSREAARGPRRGWRTWACASACAIIEFLWTRAC
jgi:hypothetical protein